MKAVVILLGTFALLLTITIMAVQPSPPKGQVSEGQIQAELQTQAETLGTLAGITDLIINSVTANGNVTKSGMNKLQKVVNLYKDIPLYKHLKKELADPSVSPPIFVLTTTERITSLYFPSLGHSCDKECVAQVRFLFNQLGADVKTVEPNTGPRDILIGAIVGFTAVAIFMFWLFRQFSLLSRLKERLDKEKAST